MSVTDLTDVSLEIAQPSLLFAHIRERRWLCVYRSVVVKDTDESYRPILELAEGLEPVIREEVADPDMLFRRAEVLTYDLGGSDQLEE
ncbi:hypothetical protein FREDWARD_82 [Mycobacterium phage Fredward]|uniref:hypothetical protein n=1 Tax=Mycobacterium phage Fredward TaxID=1354510 RepID=UPI0003BA11A4|nr:hypothetical protein V424_gp031 [Mycobacterium phage Fredward]AGY37024.1 hypothetical protein FREDWARD_82 [Mycobacterium phage Fredward]